MTEIEIWADEDRRLPRVHLLVPCLLHDLETSVPLHYGLVNWFIGQNINARPTTRFIVPYLTAVGELCKRSKDLDLQFAYSQIGKQALAGLEGAELGVDFSATVSCYSADPTGAACGHCDACELRREGFVAAAIPDPTRYQS